DHDDGVLHQPPTLIANVDLRRRPADMENQVPLAMCVHVEGAVQLIDRRATEQAVEDGKRSAHALPPGMSLLFLSAFNIRGENARVTRSPASAPARWPARSQVRNRSVLLALRNGPARQADLGKH